MKILNKNRNTYCHFDSYLAVVRQEQYNIIPSTKSKLRKDLKNFYFLMENMDFLRISFPLQNKLSTGIYSQKLTEVLLFSWNYIPFPFRSQVMQTCHFLALQQSWVPMSLTTGGMRWCARGETTMSCCKLAHATHTLRRVIWCEVGDKLQSCRLKWFTASAESDKFNLLSFTNHCGLSQTRPS